MKRRLWFRLPAVVMSVLILSTHVRGAILDDLMFYLPLDVNAADQSGNSVATTIQNSVSFDTVGIVGNAATIANNPGANTNTANYITTNGVLSIGTNDFSVSIWVQGDESFSVNQIDGTIISNKDWNSGGNVGWAIARGTVGGGGGWQWNFATAGAGRVDFDPPTATSFFEDSQWHHIAVTHDRDGSAVFYFDGASIGERDISGHEFSSIDAGLPTGIGVDGVRGNTWDAFINGMVDEAALWNRVLNEAEIQTIYNAGIHGVAVANLDDPLRLTLEVARDNGEVTLKNDTLTAIDFRGYSVFSAAGALVPQRWTSITQGGDADDGGSVDSDDRWVEFTDRATFRDLSEGSLGVATLAPGQSFSLGIGSWLQYHVEELTFEYLDADGNVISDGGIDYFGNDGSPFALGDLNFDGELNRDDWLVFAEGLGRAFPDSTLAQAYHNGDFNGDLMNDHEDFLEFKNAYDTANGTGAFARMLVPEPTSWALVLVGALFIAGQGRFGRRRQRASGFAVLMVVASGFCAFVDVSVGQTILLEEDFESLAGALGPFVSPSESGGDGTDWTDTPPAGWAVDNRQMAPGGVQEFDGWTFLDVGAWSQTAGDQQRSLFSNGNGIVAVADPDEWKDGGVPGIFNSFLESPAISLAGVDSGTVTVEFDSSWRDENTQTALLLVAYDGGPDTEVLRWESEGNSAFFKDDAPNERVQIPVIHPQGAQDMVLKWGLVDAGNNWWWAIDNLRVESSDNDLALKLDVNTVTGSVEISNETEDSVSLNYYQIDSTGGSLRSDRWNSLDNQGIDSLGLEPGDRWTAGGGSNESKLVEAFLLGSSTLGVTESISIGPAYNDLIDARDLLFSYGTDDGALQSGIVRYVDLVPCDFDGDGDCDVVDIDALFAQGDLAAGVPAIDTRFDLNGDGTLNDMDIDLWLDAASGARGYIDAILRGDANLDGTVDALDLNSLGVHWLQSDHVWSAGDFDGDGNVNVTDLNMLGVRWLSSVVPAAAVPVPEPTGHGMALFMLAGFLLVRQR